MLFSRKTKGFFVEFNENSVLLARTTSTVPPMEVEEFRECPLGDEAAITNALKHLQTKKPPSGYMHAVVGVYPPRRLVRRHTLELKKMKEAGYMADVFSQQLRVEQDKYTLAMLNAGDGADYDLSKATQKEVIFCGAPNEEIAAVQETLLNFGIYPERLELGSVATLGALVDPHARPGRGQRYHPQLHPVVCWGRGLAADPPGPRGHGSRGAEGARTQGRGVGPEALSLEHV
jgi:hypothetical protein